MDKMLRINMTNLITQEEPLPEEYRYLGGRSLTSRIVFDDVPPTCDPLGRHNKLVFAAGLMAATPLSSSGRISIGAKSPLTGGIKESNGGGTTAQRMARLGYRGLVVEGKPEPGKLFLLLIGAGRVEIKSADDLKGLGTYRLAEVLRERFGSRASLALIGPAGEMQLSSALISNTDVDGVPSRVCGRGGLGAVMGSKGLKAVVIDDSGAPPVGIHDPERFREINRELTKILIDNPQTKVFELYGTAAMVDTTNALGALPTRNFSSGSFEGAEKINGDALRQTILERGGEGRPSHACISGSTPSRRERPWPSPWKPGWPGSATPRAPRSWSGKSPAARSSAAPSGKGLRWPDGCWASVACRRSRVNRSPLMTHGR